MEYQVIFFIYIALLHMRVLVTTTSAATDNFVGGERDRVALLAFKLNIQDDPQGAMSSWNSSLHFCEWQGVTCGRKHRRVTILDLKSRGLVGTLSPYIGNLSFLMEIRLWNNTLHGEIPPEVGRLSRLEYIRLTNNSLGGKIPANISHCSNLVYLILGRNKLVGKIPEELASLSNLKVIDIAGNNLTGGIPPFIGNFTFLEFLSVGVNKFGGSIPDSLGRLKSLKTLALGACELSGTIPTSIYNLSLLTTLSLSTNQLHGSLPANFGLFFPNLQLLQINSNSFTGSIPCSLSNASELQNIHMSINNFSGKVCIDFSGLQHLSGIVLFGNNLGTGETDEFEFITSLLNCSNLQSVSLDSNSFGGTLPNTVGNFSNKLSILFIGDNHISGSIPSWIGTLINLTLLTMHDNRFTGPLPDYIGNLQNLRQLILFTNKLSGKIPASLGNLTLLNALYLHDNRFHGAIPSSLGSSQNLLFLNLSQNYFNGTVPKEIFEISSLVLLNLAQNHLVGSLPSEVGNLKSLGVLSVFGNEMTGEIPSSLGSCSSLEYLFMAGNFFHGSIPPLLSSLRGIREIDLSRNNLSGEIPDYLERFSLTYLNLSFNDFEGKVPTKGVFTNASAISVLGNKRLCGGISELKLPSCSIKEKKKQNISSLAIILISIACTLLGVTLVSFFIIFRFKKKRKEQSTGSIKTLSKISYAMLLKATDGFSTANLIGVGSFGSVYKGFLNQDEQIVAIKVLNLQRQGASKSFMAECEALRNIRHRNLLKIITSCSSADAQGNDFKALVYEFMPNGSLESWLHPIPESNTNPDQLQNLYLLHRISIVIDVACALEYLQYHCQPPIVHCDLKPSNILLDSDMVAHVGDFGLAKFLQEFRTPDEVSSIGIRGTIGYAPPEYGLGSEASISGDIYSFGIVLLEIMTGKRPTDGAFQEGHNLHNFARFALPDRVTEILDPILLSNEREEMSNNIGNPRQARNENTTEACMISLVKIGCACSMESPRERMDIRSVVRELRLARDILIPTTRERVREPYI